MAAPKVSLSDELAQIAEALECAEFVAEQMADDAMPDGESASRAPRMLKAVLTLVVGRVRLLRKVVIGEADVALVVNRHNRALPQREGDDPNVVLTGKQNR